MDKKVVTVDLSNRKDNQIKYKIVESTNLESFSENNEFKTKREILNEVNTNKMVMDCIELIDNIKKYLTDKGILFDQVCLYSNLGILCKEEYCNKADDIARSIYEMDEEESNVKKDELLEDLSSNVLNGIAHFKFYFDACKTRKDTEPVILQLKPEDHIKLRKEFTLSGLVNYSEFISKMKTFGYKVTSSYTDDMDTFDNYMSVIKENKEDNLIIESDIKLEKVDEEQENKGIKFVFTMLSEKWTNK